MSYVASYLDKMIEKKRASGDLKMVSSSGLSNSSQVNNSDSKTRTLVGKEVWLLESLKCSVFKTFLYFRVNCPCY